MIAEMDLVIKNLINLFFISHFLGAEGAAAYEVVMPCIMLVSAFVALGYNGVQTVCAKDYGASDFTMFERHKNSGYTWLIMVMTAFTLLLMKVLPIVTSAIMLVIIVSISIRSFVCDTNR